MKITSLDVQNVLGVSAVSIKPQEPIVLIAGDNGAGKSTLYQAIRLVLFDELPRVDLKRDAGALVRTGAKVGTIGISVDDDGNVRNGAVVLPSRQRSDAVDFDKWAAPIVSACLNPAEFTAMDPSERAKLLLSVSDVRMDAAMVSERLAKRGVPSDIVKLIAPILRLGFDKSSDYAKERAAEARGAWRAVTGETYGSVKADAWQPPTLAPLPEAPADMSTAVTQHSAASATLGNVRRAAQEYAAHAERAERDKALAAKGAALRKQIEDLTPTADADEEGAHLACPDCGSVLDLRDGALVKYVAPPHVTVTKSAKAAARTARAAAQRALGESEAAIVRLAQPVPRVPTEKELSDAEDAVNVATDLMSGIAGQQQRYQAAAQEHRTADARKINAAAHHKAVGDWIIAADALGAAGIPSELMNEALGPIRASIKSICMGQTVEAWPHPVLADDASISAWGRPFQMLSESEQYRVSAIMIVALAQVSAVKLIAMDRFDVLSPVVRGEFASWLGDMVDDGHIEQAWLFATMKAKLPTAEGFMESHWIDNGAEK